MERNKSNDYRKLHLIYDKYFQFVNKNLINNSIELLPNMKESIFAPGPVFYGVFDWSTRDWELVSDGISETFGIPLNELTGNKIFKLFHTQDFDDYLKKEQLVLDFLSYELKPNEWFDYKYIQTYRILCRDNKYRVFLSQVMIMEIDALNNISKTFNILSDISHLTDKPVNTVSFIGFEGKKSYYNISNLHEIRLQKTEALLSKTELSLISSLGSGLTINKISKFQNKSLETLKTQRKSAYKKLGVKNINEALAKCFLKGYL